MELKELYEMQAALDDFIVRSAFKDLQEYDELIFLRDRLLALFAEVGELANATRCFKYWSKKGPESRERLLDEYVDILHFWLSIGNTLGFSSEEVEQAYIFKNQLNYERQRKGY